MKKIIIGSVVGILALLFILQGVSVVRVQSLYNKKEYLKAYEVMDKVWFTETLGDVEMKLYILAGIDRSYRSALELKNEEHEVDQKSFESYAIQTVAQCIGQSEIAEEHGVGKQVRGIKSQMMSELSKRGVDVPYRLRKLKMDDLNSYHFAPLLYEDEALVDQMIEELY